MSDITVEFLLYAIVLIIAIYSVITIVWFTLRNGISPMPTGQRVQRVVLDVLANMNPEGVIVELGSGWGTLGQRVARQCSNCRVIGFENSPVPFLFSRLLQKVMAVPNLVFEKRNFYNVPLGDVDIVVCYLYTGAMERLREKFDQELKSGTLVISHTFAVPGWEAQEVIEVEDLYRTKVYVYRV